MVNIQEGSSSFKKYTTCYAEICILKKISSSLVGNKLSVWSPHFQTPTRICICEEGGVAVSEDRLVFSQPHVPLSETYLCIPLSECWLQVLRPWTLKPDTSNDWLMHGDWDSVRGHRGGDWSLVDSVSQAQSKSTDNVRVVLKDSFHKSINIQTS